MSRWPKSMVWKYLLFVVASGASCFGQRLSKTVEILSYKGNGRAAVGTAFFIDRQGTAVTCYHVIIGSIRLDVFPPDRPYLPANVLAVDPIHDLAIIQVVGAGETEPLVPDTHVNTSLTQQQFRIYGVLNGIPDSIVSVRSTHDTLVKTGQLLDDGKTIFAISDLDIIPLDGLISSGMSGGPLVNVRDQVVGVLSGSLSEGGTQAWAIPMEYLQQQQSTSHIDLKSFKWPPLMLMSQGPWGTLTRSLELAPSFDTDSKAISSDITTYNSLELLRIQAFDSCKASIKIDADITNTLPDGVRIPFGPGDVPNYQTFADTHTAAFNDWVQKCQSAQDIGARMAAIRGSAAAHIAQLQSDLTATIENNHLKQLPPDLATQTQASMQHVSDSLTAANSSAASITDRGNKMLTTIDPDSSNTTKLKADMQTFQSIMNLLGGDEMKSASSQYIAAMSQYQGLVSKIFAYASTAKQ
jgi:hypothetical protein